MCLNALPGLLFDFHMYYMISMPFWFCIALVYLVVLKHTHTLNNITQLLTVHEMLSNSAYCLHYVFCTDFKIHYAFFLFNVHSGFQNSDGCSGKSTFCNYVM